MSHGMNKAERLREMERLYFQRAYSDMEMAQRLDVDRTTAYRDRMELERDVPITQDEDGRYRIDRNKYLSSIRVNLTEALSLYLAARRASQQTRYAQKQMASALEKLALTLRQPMTERLVKAANAILLQQSKPERESVLTTVAEAWVQGFCVRITYQGLHARHSTQHTVRPYLLEPSPWSDSVYLIGHSDRLGKVATFKLERIERAVMSGEQFTPPADFDEGVLLKHAWGIWGGDEQPVTVKLRFAAGTATRRVRESIWHPLETVSEAEDGGCIWEAPIAEWREMLPWVRGWGADCEVIEPVEMREMVEKDVRRLAKVYGLGGLQIDERLIAHIRERDHEEQALISHLEETSHWAEQFAATVGLSEIGRILGLLHDLGKASKEFQNYLRSAEGLKTPDEDDFVDFKAMKGKVDHSTAGAQLIWRHLTSRGTEGKFLAQFVALALASHHSGLIDCLKPDGKNEFQRRMDKPDEDTHLAEALQKLPAVAQQVEEILTQPIEKRFLERLRNMNVKGESRSSMAFKLGLLARFLLSCLLDADRLNTADFEFPENELVRSYGKYHPWSSLIERLERRFMEFDREIRQMDKSSRSYQVNQIRAEVAQRCMDCASRDKGLFLLTVPTGGGKTLASLRFALYHAAKQRMGRVFYIVPYITIIDQNADKVREILEMPGERDKVVLEHHSNFVPAEDTRRRHNLLAENWDAPIVFTTQVQFLEAIFGGGTRDARRMHQLANAIIILDEVQTIPIKLTHMFIAALQFLIDDCGATVLLCTATQPPFEETGNPYRSLNVQPENHIIQNEHALFERLKRVEVQDERKLGGWTWVEMVDLAERALHEKGSLLAVMNTRASARALYDTIKARELADTYHLSTNMCPAHRMDVLEIVRAKLAANIPVICVSTQLIEAGVDIDFGAVIRSLAGLDSIAQSAGRCNRHGMRNGLGTVWVVNPQAENLERLPDIKAGREKAQTVLDDFRVDAARFDGDRIGLRAIADYYRYYFRVKEKEMDYPVNKNSSVGQDDDLYNLLSSNGIAMREYLRIHQTQPDMLLRQSFQAAGRAFHVIDSVTRGVIVPYEDGRMIIADLCSAPDLEKQYGILRKAQRYSVNLFTHQFDNLLRIGAIHEVQPGAGIYHLDEQFYSKEVGWTDEPVGDMTLHIL